MYPALNPGAVQVSPANLEEAIQLAKRAGFRGVEFAASDVTDRIDRDGVGKVRAMFEEAGVEPTAFVLPPDWRGDEATWRADLEKLPRLAEAAASIGCRRTFIWIISGSNERRMAENRAFHVERLTPVARVLAEHDIRLGLEFLGPKTIRDGFEHPFLYRMHDMLELAREIGPNVGLLLDCWHWYTSGGTEADLRRLKADDVVYVHVNDAPTGVAVDEQIDNRRALPAETGVIDIAAFLQSLQAIGYDGPVTPEPFKKDLAALPDDAARLQTVAESMQRMWEKAGVAPA